MSVTVQIDDLIVEADSFKEETAVVSGKEKRKISFSFKVRSDESHEVTTALYKNDFIVKVKESGLEFPAVIANYRTSITDLSVEDAVADFALELIEKG